MTARPITLPSISYHLASLNHTSTEKCPKTEPYHYYNTMDGCPHWEIHAGNVL